MNEFVRHSFAGASSIYQQKIGRFFANTISSQSKPTQDFKLLRFQLRRRIFSQFLQSKHVPDIIQLHDK